MQSTMEAFADRFLHIVSVVDANGCKRSINVPGIAVNVQRVLVRSPGGEGRPFSLTSSLIAYGEVL